MRGTILSILDPRRTLRSLSGKITAERGLTLVEIIVVLMMIGIIGAFVGGKVFKAGDKAKAELTRAKLNALKEPIYMFQMRFNALPNDLRAAEAEDTKDAWGREVQYRIVDGGGRYELMSLGADGRSGGSSTDADIVVAGP